jgi:diaminopimelate decarboxylase
MLTRIPPEELSAAFCAARAAGLVGDEDTAAVFYDLARIKARARSVIEAFPPGALHAAAVKANPLPSVLRRLGEWGMGLEAASLGELELACGAGVPPERIVFDSPAKTRVELARALRAGVHINADSFAEIDRLRELITGGPGGGPGGATGGGPGGGPRVGLRVNPQVGTGRFAYTSTAGHYSKFGVTLAEHRDQLLQAYRSLPWLQGVHVHIGSQACPPEQMVEGIRLALDFALEAERVSVFDIGGGIPVAYGFGDAAPSMSAYAGLLRARCPELFDGRLRLVTEFGRYLHANAGWIVSRVEYVKTGGGKRTLIVHVGADLLMRECYFPEHWRHEMVVLDPAGRVKTGPGEPYVVAGPLCFAGDVITPEIGLPPVAEGDYLVIRDTGAYTLAMWSRFVSRQCPKVIGYHGVAGAYEILKGREELERVLEFWR